MESGLFFANADWVAARVRAQAERPDVRAVVLDTETIPFIDVSASRMLAGLAEELAGNDVALVLARDVGQVRDVLDRTAEGHLAVFRSVREAVMRSSGRDSQESI